MNSVLFDKLINPAKFVAGVYSLVIGLASILVAGALAYLSGSRFDGTLDFHTGSGIGSAWHLLDGIINWLTLSILLFVCAKFFSKTRFRAIDLFGTQALARWPSILSAGVGLIPAIDRYGKVLIKYILQGGSPADLLGFDGLIFLGGTLVILIGMCWMVTLMYRGFAVSCNLKGPKTMVAFIVSLIVAEVISKLAIASLSP